MENQSVVLVLEKYCGKTRKHTLFIQYLGSDELIECTPTEIFENEALKSCLSASERERVAYLAGMTHINQLAEQITKLKKLPKTESVSKPSKDARKKRATKNS
jgi:hypothetical protein